MLVLYEAEGLMPTVSADKSGFVRYELYPFIMGITGYGIDGKGGNIVKIKCKNNARVCFLVSIVGNNNYNSLKYIYRYSENILYKNLAGYTGYNIKYKIVDNVVSIYIGTIQDWGRVAVIPFSLDMDSIESISEYDTNLTDAVQG